MPSRYTPPPRILVENSATPRHRHHINLFPLLIAAGAAAVIIVIFLILYYFRKLNHKTAFTNSAPPFRFSYASLRRATSSFSADRLLGQGGFGSVYAGTLKNHQNIAVKVMDAGSLQGEREFQNELFLASRFDSRFILSVIGFCSDRKRRRMVLVYELMSNGSLQRCLLQCKSAELESWNIRFSIAVDIAKGLEYLHHYCDPPVIHGDIKPSNILLDANFNAKIGDFGLASLKSKDVSIIQNNEGAVEEDSGLVIKEADSTCDEINVGLDKSPESCVTLKIVERSPEVASVSDGFDRVSASEGKFESGKEKVNGERKKSGLGKDWWRKQDNGGGEAGRVKDYVMEWIGNEIKKERPKNDWIGGSSSSGVIGKSERKKRGKRRLDWWVSLDEEKNLKRDTRRPAREWWKEEFCEELSRKKKKREKQGNNISSVDNAENWWLSDDDSYVERKTKRSRSKGSVDWFLDGLSSELGRAQRSSHDSVSGEIPKSGGISSTPSMRGTVCYIAPEYCSGTSPSEMSDVYSFGVVLLVLISGRRPLQVTGSPMAEFKRANLVSWARHLARAGKLLDLVDQSIHSLDAEQALLCITVALLCLQKSPLLRPSMKEVVAMLTGNLEPPVLPVELSPSPHSPFASKSRRKPR